MVSEWKLEALPRKGEGDEGRSPLSILPGSESDGSDRCERLERKRGSGLKLTIRTAVASKGKGKPRESGGDGRKRKTKWGRGRAGLLQSDFAQSTANGPIHEHH
ncbi:hypothetical protein OIU85_008805 [Salix viminalis]|uniref:Uncharacterized protein n=1 Tax=Salix viminalis TaxID=40686 RepID=A0A9Q0NYD2_SALVM|nr:hypothetical protein OIU85_008805 [Salix viminalis]